VARAAIISAIYFGICSSANGAASLPAWGSAPGILTASERALKARLNRARCFNPTQNVRRTRRVFAQELAVFFLKGAAAMVFLPGIHVFEEGVELARAHRKRAVAALPVKAAIVRGRGL
jgi:hypothetical protein